jgi:hypothetical protein
MPWNFETGKAYTYRYHTKLSHRAHLTEDDGAGRKPAASSAQSQGAGGGLAVRATAKITVFHDFGASDGDPVGGVTCHLHLSQLQITLPPGSLMPGGAPAAGQLNWAPLLRNPFFFDWSRQGEVQRVGYPLDELAFIADIKRGILHSLHAKLMVPSSNVRTPANTTVEPVSFSVEQLEPSAGRCRSRYTHPS